MTAARFLAGLTGHDNDFQLVAQALESAGEPFCLIGGLAVNHYVEPVVTLDADFAVAGHTRAAQALTSVGFEVKEHPHSLNAQLPGSRLRVQITLGPLPHLSFSRRSHGSLWSAPPGGFAGGFGARQALGFGRSRAAGFQESQG